MILEFVTNFDDKKDEIKKEFETSEPNCYFDIVKTTIKHIFDEDKANLDYNKIHEINDGDWQGTLLYVIPEKCYQPSRYWAVYVDYGSCSGCDTLQAIQENNDNNKKLDDYMTLSLHIVQGLREI